MFLYKPKELRSKTIAELEEGFQSKAYMISKNLLVQVYCQWKSVKQIIFMLENNV